MTLASVKDVKHWIVCLHELRPSMNAMCEWGHKRVPVCDINVGLYKYQWC
jgi:hypothetical protein